MNSLELWIEADIVHLTNSDKYALRLAPWRYVVLDTLEVAVVTDQFVGPVDWDKFESRYGFSAPRRYEYAGRYVVDNGKTIRCTSYGEVAEWEAQLRFSLDKGEGLVNTLVRREITPEWEEVK